MITPIEIIKWCNKEYTKAMKKSEQGDNISAIIWQARAIEMQNVIHKISGTVNQKKTNTKIKNK